VRVKKKYLIKDALHLSKVTVKTFIILQKILFMFINHQILILE